MSIKLIAIIIFLFIISSLAVALYNLVRSKDPNHSAKTLKSLTIRIGLSIVLLLGIIMAYSQGLFQPQGIGARIEHLRQHQPQAPHSALEP